MPEEAPKATLTGSRDAGGLSGPLPVDGRSADDLHGCPGEQLTGWGRWDIKGF